MEISSRKEVFKMDFWGPVIIIAVTWIIIKLRDVSFDNYMPPSDKRIDHNKAIEDLAKGMSKDEVMNKTLCGEYNIPKDE